MNKSLLKNKAFSILEVVIAIGIMAVGMLGVSSLMIQNLQAENIDRDYLTASMLAQEGLELVRNQRDLNWLTAGADWYANIIGDGSYAIDYYPDNGSAINIVDVDGGIDNARLKIDDYGFYAHDITGGKNTSFFRLIEVEDNIASGGYLKVTCTVRFYRLKQVKDYVVSTRLYPWRY